jgi:23S rRNA G2445 N2-methylase RlmL
MKNVILLTTPKGLAPYLQKEIEDLGMAVKWSAPTSVQTEGDFTDAMKLNLHVRTAHHVLYLLAEFACKNPDDLYNGTNKIPWETIIPVKEYLTVESHADHPSIRDSRYVNVKCKDAIVDRINSRKGRRPDSGPERTGAVVNVFWKNERCRVYLDTSGETLSRRGYRKIPFKAPMQETLAAGVVLATGWEAGESFVNPMCGSGTLAIEASLIGQNIAPGLTRGNFGFMHTNYFDETKWEQLKNEAVSGASKEPGKKIIATDIDPEAIEAGRKNAAKAGVADSIEFRTADFNQTEIPPHNGVIVLNPEYGLRMGDEQELENTYRQIGSFLKHNCQGYRGYVFTGNFTLAGKIGLKSKRRIPFQNGNVECRLYEYELYQGSATAK